MNALLPRDILIGSASKNVKDTSFDDSSAAEGLFIMHKPLEHQAMVETQARWSQVTWKVDYGRNSLRDRPLVTGHRSPVNHEFCYSTHLTRLLYVVPVR